MNLSSYAYAIQWVSGNVSYPIRVIADRDVGMLLERDDVWQALGYTPAYSEQEAGLLTHTLHSMFPAIDMIEIQVGYRPERTGHRVEVHIKARGVQRMHRMYFTWENTMARTLHKQDSGKTTTFGDIVAHVGDVYPDEFVWNLEKYIGRHKDLAITVYARGAHVGITKVHVDNPEHAQKVFRGDPDRIADLIEQAKAHCREQSNG
ncbi:hypothetical protein D3C85_576740 [compost metagenome]